MPPDRRSLQAARVVASAPFYRGAHDAQFGMPLAEQSGESGQLAYELGRLVFSEMAQLDGVVDAGKILAERATEFVAGMAHGQSTNCPDALAVASRWGI